MVKRKKRGIGGKQLIIISSIIALNAMGVSYAYWTDRLQIITTLTTGNIHPEFIKDSPNIKYIEKETNSGEQCSVTLNKLKATISKDRRTMNITGTIEEGYNAIITYGIFNDGTIPVKYQDIDQINISGTNIDVDQIAEDAKPVNVIAERGEAQQELQIIVSNDTEEQSEKVIPISLVLPFDQWTNN